MITLSEATVSEFALCDAELHGIHWLEEGRDLQLQLESADHRRASLTCVWVWDVSIDLKYGPNRMGLTSSWECRIERDGDHWHMEFELPPEGRIKLDCNEDWLEYENADQHSLELGGPAG